MQFRMVVEYDGTGFQGWQVQPGERTVQSVLEDALQKLLQQRVRVRAAGRTDAGVHAAGQVVCFRTDYRRDCNTVLKAMNALTPPDIGIREVDVVPDDFDPRGCARSRTYVYRIWNRAVPSPFWARYAWHLRRCVAAERMDCAARDLLGEHDFTSFRAAGCQAVSPVRQVLKSRVLRDGDLVVYEIEATGFLRHMVRNIVGFLVEIGAETRAPEEIAAVLAARDRGAAGITAPPHGLCLKEVCY
jgi:tRNA pseudouridine38-40 synthase